MSKTLAEPSPEQPTFGAANFAPAKIELPKGGGAIRGVGEKFAANAVTGTGTMTLPLPLASGRAGFGPKLELAYDSGTGNGPFGLGWQLSVPAITRKTDKGLPSYGDFDMSDVFLLSGAEDLVPVLKDGPGGTQQYEEVERDGYSVRRYRPRIEGLFARIERWARLSDGDVHWRSIAKDNTLSLYGTDLSSRVADPHDPHRVFSWLLTETRDDKGNAVAYDYKPEDATGVDLTAIQERNRGAAGDPRRAAPRYLKRVRYGNRTPLLDADGNRPAFVDTIALNNAGWMFETVLDYGEHDALAPRPGDMGDWGVRKDPFSAYRSTFELRCHRLCRRVLTFHNFADDPQVGTDCLVRSLELAYLEDARGTLLSSATQASFARDGGGYRRRAYPPVTFEYSKAEIQDDIKEVDGETLLNLPIGLDRQSYSWVDLHGEGLNGILTEQGGAWYYKRNLGSGAFEAPQEIARRPSTAALSRGAQQWIDVEGDGRLDLVELEGPSPGYWPRTTDEDFAPMRRFAHLPNARWQSPNLKMIDLDGDGIADVLITEQDVIKWHRSEGEDGFGAERRVSRADDEEQGPTLLLDDGTQSIFLADMSGDGLTDLVRVRNGEICYWPNIGYGRFGAKVTMSAAPRFDRDESFQTARLRLADIDGSGCADIIYLGAAGVQIYFNECGNSWSALRALTRFPRIDDHSSVSTLDLLGDGTICLAWSSALPGDARRPLRYVDLMGGIKPRLLVRTTNGMGAETTVQYTPSTRFYLADRKNGTPWITRLPFPMHVVERVETLDRVSRNRFVSRYAYHHGYFDGAEREFRGFARVEQFDTEELGVLSDSGDFPDATNIDAASYVPTVLTKTWYHTGAFIGGAAISQALAREYWREDGLDDDQARCLLLADTVLPQGLSALETREAVRALKGSVLRSEVYALDGSQAAGRPYRVTETNYSVGRLQSFGPNQHAVFLSHARETITMDYERALYPVGGGQAPDPRVQHALVLEVDAFGNELRSVAVNYGRRHDDPDPVLKSADRANQKKIAIVSRESSYTNAVDLPDAYRAPAPVETVSYEILKLAPQGEPGAPMARFGFAEMVAKLDAAGDGAHDLPFEDVDAAGATGTGPYRRRIARKRVLYRKDDLTGALPPGKLGSLGLTFDSYELVFTPGLLAQCYQRQDGGNKTVLLTGVPLVLGGKGPDQGGYVDLDGDGHWWAPSGRTFMSKGANVTAPQSTAAAELAEARAHFFLPRLFADPFDRATAVDYDANDLLAVAALDVVQNRIAAEYDYRILQPRRVVDPNGNVSDVVFDALGKVAGTAVMGKDGEGLGDTLAGFDPDPTPLQISQFFADPRGMAAALLGQASARVIYDVGRYAENPAAARPVYAATITRETHVSDLGEGETSALHISFSYSDGFGREIQKKIQAEPGPLVAEGADVDPRWVADGWKIFNNKAKPVRAYEAFFDDTHEFRFGNTVGVTATLFYDPLGRAVATLHPDHTWEKVVFDPWRQTSFDVNDTVLVGDPSTDADAGAYFARLPSSDFLPSWYDQRIGGGLGPEQQQAAQKAAAYAATPSIAVSDAQGRKFLSILDNGLDGMGNRQLVCERQLLDVQGRQRAVNDALGRIVVRYDYDMQGARLHQSSMEAGERWTLNSVAKKPIRVWDSRAHVYRSAYDALQRSAESYLKDGAAAEVLIERTIYGEGVADDVALNMRGKPSQIFDQAGIITFERYDFKGNATRSTRQLAQAYRTLVDWSDGGTALDGATYFSETRYDALNRAVKITAPDGSTISPAYNEANLLDHVDVRLAGAADSAVFVDTVEYDAKGRRTRVVYGNGAATAYEYDPLTFRLTRLITTRSAASLLSKIKGLFGSPDPDDTLQDLNYVYDPGGNIVRIRDDAQQTLFFRNKRVEPSSDYTYDAIGRLIAASGREHLGLDGGAALPPTAPNADNTAHVGIAQPGDGTALGLYSEQYVYDAVGNILSLQHRGSDPANPGWTRSYEYGEASQIEPGKLSNRLSRTKVGIAVETYQYAGPEALHGNITAMTHLPLMRWNHRDQLRCSSRQAVNSGTPRTTWYVYDNTGQRVRKVTDGPALEGVEPVRESERIYLGPFEIYREYDADGESVLFERDTLHVMDDKQRIALIEVRVEGDDGTAEELVRYQLGNHLGSAALEIDDAAAIISYEEFFPYGSTSYEASDSSLKPAAKRYRFTGQERDEENCFTYHGARYYAPWLGRWTACDPTGIADGANLYAYAHENPIRLRDPSGSQGNPWDAGGGLGTVTSGGNILTIDMGGGIRFGVSNSAAYCGLPWWQRPAASANQPRYSSSVVNLPTVVVTPQQQPQAPAAPPQQPPERSFWSRGGGTLVGGAVTLGIGILIIASGPVGWVAALAGGLALAGGVATTSVGAIELGMSYSGQTTAQQDEDINRATSTTLMLSSPGGLLGGVGGVMIYGDEEGLRRGALVGGLTEAGVTIGIGGGRMVLRELEFGAPASSAWNDVRGGIQDVYGLGNAADRVRPNALFYRGREFVDLSHFIPQRSIRGYEWLFNRPWNVTPMWATEHAMIDAYRFQFMSRAFKAAYGAEQLSGLPRLLGQMPPWMLQTGYGAARGGLDLGLYYSLPDLPPPQLDAPPPSPTQH